MYKVRYIESEAGWGSDIWITEYKTEKEALEMVKKTNDYYGNKSRTPSYYILAEYLGEN